MTLWNTYRIGKKMELGHIDHKGAVCLRLSVAKRRVRIKKTSSCRFLNRREMLGDSNFAPFVIFNHLDFVKLDDENCKETKKANEDQGEPLSFLSGKRRTTWTIFHSCRGAWEAMVMGKLKRREGVIKPSSKTGGPSFIAMTSLARGYFRWLYSLLFASISRC